ncbi:MAG: hypothetical protein MUC36_12760 [Planctomycetes bacterium]|nr:hypothetical protein [Planctomycetota bacterium]
MLAVLSTLLPLLGLVSQEPDRPAEPPRIEWQRNIEDALAAQQATGLPLLVVANMDGETFNDRFALSVYRDPAFIAATRGYICVIGSTDRHNERDYDASGQRIECPRFPGCTCSEHIQIEPELFRRWFDGKRTAPRHIGVAPDGKVLFDRFLDHSMQTAIEAIVANKGTPKVALDATADLDALLARRDGLARRTLEGMYRRGDFDTRRKLLEAAANASTAQFDLLRRGLRDPDDTLATLAAAALAKVATAEARIDLEDALARIREPEVERELLQKLAELGRNDPATSRLAAHLAIGPGELPSPWSGPWGKAAFDGDDRQTIEAELDRCEAALRTMPDEDLLRLQLATAQAGLAHWLVARGGKGPELWFEDARRNAARVKSPALQAEALAVTAIAAWFGGDGQGAHTALAQALAKKSSRPPDAWLAAAFLDVLMPLTAQLAYGRAQPDSPVVLRTELERVQAALGLLHDRGAFAFDSGALAGIALLEFCGLRQTARYHLGLLTQRLPGSVAAHDRWQARLLIDLGTDGLVAAYDTFAAKATDAPTAEWFAGRAALVAAEQNVRDSRAKDAATCYASVITRMQRSSSGNADYTDTANHHMVQALAGGASLKFAAGDAAGAVADLLRAGALRPESLDEPNSLQQTPRAIAARIHDSLQKQGKTELAQQLKPLLP